MVSLIYLVNFNKRKKKSTEMLFINQLGLKLRIMIGFFLDMWFLRRLNTYIVYCYGQKFSFTIKITVG